MMSAIARAGSVLVGVGLLLGMLPACSPEPKPTPTPTALFASDEEAFAAAEETYRAYTDAVNEIDLSDTSTFEPVFDWLTGTALTAERESLSQYHAEKLIRVGESKFDTFEPLSWDQDNVIVNICIDVNDVDLRYEDGVSALSPDRASRAARKVTFVPAETSTGLKITSNHRPDGDFSC